MPGWLFIFIGRWISGERFRKATSKDYRLHFGAFFLSGLMMLIFLGTGLVSSFLDRADALSLGVAWTVVVALLVFGSFTWARIVPAAVSLILAILTWAIFVWIMLRQSHVL